MRDTQHRGTYVQAQDHPRVRVWAWLPVDAVVLGGPGGGRP